MSSNPAGWFELAWSLTMQGKREEAETALTKCFDLGGNDWKLIALDEEVVAKLIGGE